MRRRDVPEIVLRIVDAKCGTVHQQAFPVSAPVTRRRDPHILYGTSLQHPAEMHFRCGLATAAFGIQVFQRTVPRADELPVQHYVCRAVGRRPVGVECFQAAHMECRLIGRDNVTVVTSLK